MVHALQCILGDELTLPHDLEPDDTELVFWPELGQLQEIDPGKDIVDNCDFDDPSGDESADDSDDEIVTDPTNREHYSDLALAYFNKIHDTHYKLVLDLGAKWCSHTKYGSTHDIIHHGFTAAETTDEHSIFKEFFAVLKRVPKPVYGLDVSSCCTVDGLKTIGCKMCDELVCKPGFRVEYSIESIKSKYGHWLDDDVNLNDKARFRMEIRVLALAHFNKKKKKDYKLVDALPDCIWIDSKPVIHCNFIARQNSPEDDVSKKLFFAEIQLNGFVKKGVPNWVVRTCVIIHGCETRAGCLICTRREGRRIVHPPRGFFFGLYPRKLLRSRHSPPLVGA